MEHMGILKQMGLFQGLDSLELIQVSKLVKHRRYDVGDTVLKEGEEGDSLFVVKSGQFRAFVSYGGTEKELAVFKPAASFGELALMDHGPRSATVVALVKGELLEFTSADLETLMGHSERLKICLQSNIITDLALKLRRTNDRLLHLL
jgi:CRP-like cAMP-binding protein